MKTYYLYGVVSQDPSERYKFIEIITTNNEEAMQRALYLQNNKIYWNVHVREFNVIDAIVPPEKYEMDIPLSVRNVING